MKKYLVLALFILGSLQLSAQFGFRGGINSASLKYSEGIEDTKNLLGCNLGLFYDYKFSSKVGLRISGNFIRKGVQRQSFLGTYTKAKFNNLEIGSDLLCTLISKGNKKLSVYAGPQLGYILKLTYDYGASAKEEFDFVEDDEIFRVDYGINGGITFNVSSIFIGMNYNFGLSNIDDSTLIDYKVSHRVLSFLVGKQI